MKNILFLFALLIGLQVSAQEKFRITFKDGTVQDFSVGRIKDITCFEEKEHNIVGEWVSVNQAKGSFDVYTLNEDGTCAWRNCSGTSDYTFDGNYTYANGVLTLVIYGMEMPFEISWKNDCYFNIETQAFYAVSSEMTVSKGDGPVFAGAAENEVVAADNVYVGLQDNKVYGLKNGTGYAIVQDSEKGQMVAYKIKVVASSNIQAVHFDENLGMSESDIIAKYGDKNVRLDKEGYHTLSYMLYSDEIRSLIFYIDDETKEVYQITASFNSAEDMEPYAEDIASRFIFDTKSSETRKKYYDSLELSQRKISITVSSSANMITYTDYTH